MIDSREGRNERKVEEEERGRETGKMRRGREGERRKRRRSEWEEGGRVTERGKGVQGVS